MVHVMITCPKTGRNVPTGIVFGSLAAFDGATLVNNVVGCGECGETHIVDNETVKAFPQEP